MAHLVVFPWKDREEVRHVYEELFSSNVKRQKHALDRISVWKCRSMNRLPSAVESTASFIKAQIASYEEEFNHAERVFYLRNLYSMALTRFVNHITERGQQGTFARPVHIIASQVGVPEWIVELRHEATHGSLPSLSELKAATTWALKWLRDKFWEPQMSETYAVSSLRCAAIDMLKDSLVTYMQRKFQELNGGDVISCKQVLTDIEHVFDQLGSSACSVILEDGYLIFTEDQLKCLGYSFADLNSSGSLLLPGKLVQFWKKVIHLLVKRNLIVELLLHISSSVTESHSSRNDLLCRWLYTIVWHNKGGKNKKGHNLFQGYIDMPFKCLLEKCLHLRNCNRIADELLNLLIDNVSLEKEQKHRLKQLLLVHKNPSENSQTYSISRIQSVNDILKYESSAKPNSWKKCTEPVVWSQYPIGILPNQILDYRSLSLETCHPADSVKAGDSLSEESNIEAMDDEASSTETIPVSENGEQAISVQGKSGRLVHWEDRMKHNIAKQIQLF